MDIGHKSDRQTGESYSKYKMAHGSEISNIRRDMRETMQRKQGGPGAGVARSTEGGACEAGFTNSNMLAPGHLHQLTVAPQPLHHLAQSHAAPPHASLFPACCCCCPEEEARPCSACAALSGMVARPAAPLYREDRSSSASWRES